MSYVVKEIIHHGNYRAERTIELYELSPIEVQRMVEGCSYITREVPIDEARRYARDLEIVGRFNAGWVRWLLMTDETGVPPEYQYPAAQQAYSMYGKHYADYIETDTAEKVAKGYDVAHRSLGEAFIGNDGD